MKIKNRKTIVALLMCIVFSLSGYAQSGDDIWKNLVVKETAYYRLSIPASFRALEMSPNTNPEQYFEASGRFLPITYNNAPVIVTIFVTNQEAGGLKEAKEDTVKGYRKNPDKVFAKGFSHEEKIITLKSGEKAYLLNTRFYMKEKRLNQSRYDLVVYSAKARKAYLYTLSIQYNDAEYKFERQYKLKEIARKLYENFQLIRDANK